MIRLTERHVVERDKYQWLLHESVPGKDKEGNPKVSIRTTYHSTLTQVCSVILDRGAGNCLTVREIRDLWDTLCSRMEEAIVKSN